MDSAAIRQSKSTGGPKQPLIAFIDQSLCGKMLSLRPYVSLFITLAPD
jgi:hypothetical protein